MKRKFALIVFLLILTMASSVFAATPNMEIVEDNVLQISVSDIETGSYLLQSNTKVVKFIKK